MNRENHQESSKKDDKEDPTQEVGFHLRFGETLTGKVLPLKMSVETMVTKREETQVEVVRGLWNNNKKIRSSFRK